jgi:hypothetical protein
MTRQPLPHRGLADQSAIVELLEVALEALAKARRLVLEGLPMDEPDDLPELPES